MDFTDSPDDAAYRARARDWLAANGAEYRTPPAEPYSRDELVRRSRAWQKAKHQAGYTGITWPKSMGGQGLSPMHAIIFNQEQSRYFAPTGLFEIGLGMCIPTVFTHGSPEIIARYVAPALAGDEVWCQLFSEPAAGSDLAGIRTRAVRDSDAPDADWIIDGQKVWTTNAHLSDYGIIVTRTDPSVPKHKGLTMFIVDMHGDGVEARPLKQMSGGSDFNEVFFTGVRVKDSHRLGAVGDGWKVALTTLMNERLAVGGKPSHAPDYAMLMDFARRIETDTGPAIEQRDVRQRVAAAYIADEGIKLTQMRALSALSKGQVPGPEQSISKVVVAKTMQEMGALALDLSEAAGLVTADADPVLAKFQGSYMAAAGLRIAGGTDEILRNIIAERVLGLPGDLRPDKDAPFNAAVAA
ncbi:MAG: acyl-CoA dehydrogenase family protein [Sphingomonadaceae bacterium]|nr:acyl-CoA dehydrogenase family protein [Sphingomonadaceae bacterium]